MKSTEVFLEDCPTMKTMYVRMEHETPYITNGNLVLIHLLWWPGPHISR